MSKTKRNNPKNSSRKTLKKHENIAKQLQNHSSEEIQKEFQKLRAMTRKQILQANGRTRLGNKVVDHYTLVERLHSKGDQNVSFYQFWENRKTYSKKPYIKKMIDFYKSRQVSSIRKMKYIYNLYFSNIAIFRPVMAMEVYCRVNAKRLLDFTMGWGGRLVGACALNLDAYYGIDSNTHLRKPYESLTHFLQSQTPSIKTEINLLFQDALTVDYSKMDYDTVFTSPPYYDIERYRNMSQKYKSKEMWNKEFYQPLFRITYNAMKVGGHYCINVSQEIYESACVPILGKCSRKIRLKKGERLLNNTTKPVYTEYIYIWKKKTK